MSKPKTRLGVVGWNVNCATDPYDQISHILSLDKKMRKSGCQSVIFCLSEMTAPLSGRHKNEITLHKLLNEEGYSNNSRPTSKYRRKNVYEGIGFASKDPNFIGAIKKAKFHDTRDQWAHWFKIQNILHRHKLHERRVGEIKIDDLTIYNTHASFHTPPNSEISRILEAAGTIDNGEKKLLIGDMNAGTKRIIRRLESRGWQRLRGSGLQRTWKWLTLDYAFTSPALKKHAKLKLADRGPSDHRPLLVLIDQN